MSPNPLACKNYVGAFTWEHTFFPQTYNEFHIIVLKVKKTSGYMPIS